MAKIKGIKCIRTRVNGTWTIVKVITDQPGLYGIGSASDHYHPEAVIEVIEHLLAPRLIGRDVAQIEDIWQATMVSAYWRNGPILNNALSGVDMALWDLRGKIAGVPVRRLLRADAADRVPAYASVLWPDTPEQVGPSASSFVDAGYRFVKYGWGPMGADATLDEELVAAARQALGDVALMVDAGRAWDAATAIERAGSFAAYDIAWLEEALHPYDFDGHRHLCAESAVPIAGGEAITLMEEYEQLLATGLHFVQPDLGRVGGISYGQRLAERSLEVG